MPIGCSQKQQEDIKVGDIVERDIDGMLFPAKVRSTVRIHENEGMWSTTAERGRTLVVGGRCTNDYYISAEQDRCACFWLRCLKYLQLRGLLPEATDINRGLGSPKGSTK